MEDKRTVMMTLLDELKLHEYFMEKSPEVIEVIEKIYLREEKNQISNAYTKGVEDMFDNKTFMTGEMYYNQTYKNEIL